MGNTRQFDFIVGPETDTLPTVGTPTDDEDTISKGYADDTYFRKTIADTLTEVSEPGTPSAGTRYFYAKSDGIYHKDSSGDEFKLGAGGGGGSITWSAPDGEAPVKGQEFDSEVYKFDVNEGQKLVAFVKVPQTYIAGAPIKMFIGVYSPSSSGNMLLISDSYLIRNGTDNVASVTNKHDSTNTQLTNTVTNQYRQVELDLTDGSGEVNSVAVSSGDMLRVEISRDTANETSSDTNETRFIPSATETTFSA